MSTDRETSATATVRVAAVGDLMLGREVTARYGADAASPAPFAGLVEIVGPVDLLIGNLETPLIDGRESTVVNWIPKFAAPTAFATALKGAGFDVLSLANNHILDQGPEGVWSTLEAVRGAGIQPIGILESADAPQVPAIAEHNGRSVGCLAYSRSAVARRDSPGSAPLKLERMLAEIRSLRAQVDHVVVALHVGFEWAPVPPYRVVRLVEALLEAGVDVIFGHHPHVPQGIVPGPSGGVAFYSLGNCVSDMHDPEIAARGRGRAAAYGSPFARRYYDRVAVGMVGRATLGSGGLEEHSHTLFDIGPDYFPTEAGSPGGNLKLVHPNHVRGFMTEARFHVGTFAADPRRYVGDFAGRLARRLGPARGRTSGA